MIKNPEVGMIVFSVFGIMNKEHMFIGEIVEIKPEWKPASLTVQWKYPTTVRFPACPDELFISMLDAKHEYQLRCNQELDKEILEIYKRYPAAVDAPKQEVL